MTKYRPILIPKSKVNPTQTTALLIQATKEAKQRVSAFGAEALAAFAAIPVHSLNLAQDEEEEQVAYGLSTEEMIALAALLALLADRYLVDGDYRTSWFSRYVDDARRLGLAQSSSNLAGQDDVYRWTRPLESVLSSLGFRSKSDLAKIESFNHWKGLSDDAKLKLSNIITQAVKQGTPPAEVVKQLETAIGVTASKAKRIADTDIPIALREAIIEEGEEAAKALGVEVKLLWVSALTPTTRSWHASRHSRLYTAAEVRAFYSVNGNRYSCKCSVTQVILRDGVADINPAIQQRMKAAKVAWQKENE